MYPIGADLGVDRRTTLRPTDFSADTHVRTIRGVDPPPPRLISKANRKRELRQRSGMQAVACKWDARMLKPNLGILLAIHGDLGAAIEAFQAALKLNPKRKPLAPISS